VAQGSSRTAAPAEEEEGNIERGREERKEKTVRENEVKKKNRNKI
jgi:hypothetical protein